MPGGLTSGKTCPEMFMTIPTAIGAQVLALSV